jgi:hypothetical protein
MFRVALYYIKEIPTGFDPSEFREKLFKSLDEDNISDRNLSKLMGKLKKLSDVLGNTWSNVARVDCKDCRYTNDGLYITLSTQPTGSIDAKEESKFNTIVVYHKDDNSGEYTVAGFTITAKPVVLPHTAYRINHHMTVAAKNIRNSYKELLQNDTPAL